MYTTIGVSIEGVYYNDPATYPDGAMFYIGEAPPASAVGNYEWRPLLLEYPQFSSMRGDPLEASLVTSSTNITLRRDQTMARRLLVRKARYPKYLGEAISASATTFSMAQTGAIDSGTVLYVGNEAMLVGASNSSGEVTVTRGVLGTRAEPHGLGDFVSLNIPTFISGRVIRLWVVRQNGTLLQRWEGIIEKPQAVNFGVELTCRSNPAFWTGGNLNLNAIDLQGTGVLSFNGRRFDGTIEVDAETIDGTLELQGTQPVASRVFKTASAANKPVALRVGDALTLGIVRGVFTIDVPAVGPILGSKFEPDEEDIVSQGQWTVRLRAEGPYQEVFLVSPLADRFSQFWLGGDVSATRDMPYPYHPLTIAGCLLFSDRSTSNDTLGYNVLNGDYFGCDFISLASPNILNDLNALIEETRELKVDYFILGWETEPEDVFESVRSLCHQYGFWITTDENGRFSFSRSGLLNIYDLADADQNPLQIRAPSGAPSLGYTPDDDRSADVIMLEVGELPWKKPITVPVTTTGVSDRRQKLGRGREARITLDTITSGNFLTVKELFVNRAIQYAEAPPRIALTVQEVDGGKFGLGEVKRLPLLPLWRANPSLSERYPWLLDRLGDVTSDTDSDGFLGRIVESQWQPSTRTYNVVLELTNYFAGAVAKLRAPSARVASHSSGGTSILTVDTDLSLVGADHFRAGDEVELFKVNGAHSTDNSGLYVIDSIAGNQITLTTTIADTVAVVGEVLRLAYVQGVSGWYNPDAFINNVERPWVYQGSDEGEDAEVVTLPYSSGVDGDIYG